MVDAPTPGRKLKVYRLYRLGLDDVRLSMVADFDTEAEAMAFKRKADWTYGLFFGDKKIWPDKK